MHWVTLAQAAEIAEVSTYALKWAILTRRLGARRVIRGGGFGRSDLLVDASELEAWKASRLPKLISY